MSIRFVASALVALTALWPVSATAQPYPSRPVRLLVGYAPGGPTDILARLIGPTLAAELGQQVIIENRPGASANIAGDAVAKSPPDGYTLLFGDIVLTVNPALFKALPFDAVRDLVSVGMVAYAPVVLAAHPSTGANTVSELVALAKGRPGQLNFGSAGSGSPPHLVGELFKATYGLDIAHVPYKGVGPALVDLVGGRLSLMFVGVSAVKPHVDAARVRALAISGKGRSASLPRVPTFAEAGTPLPEIDFGAWWGVLAPAGTARDIVLKINRALARAMDSPELRERLAQVSIEPASGTAEEFAAFMQTETKKWAGVISRARIQPE